MLTLLLGISFIALFFGLMTVRIWLKKDGEFRGTCATQSPFLNREGITCSVCGKEPGQCENE